MFMCVFIYIQIYASVHMQTNAHILKCNPAE